MYGQYLVDLRDNLPEELLKMYDTNSIKEACSYNGELVGIVTFIHSYKNWYYLFIYLNNKIIIKMLLLLLYLYILASRIYLWNIIFKYRFIR